MKQILSLSFLIILTASLKVLFFDSKHSHEEHCGFVQNGHLERVSLKKKVLKLHIHSSIPAKFHASIKEAVQFWNKAHGKAIFLLESTVLTDENLNNAKKNGHSVLFLKKEWDENRPSEQARTVIFWEGSQIQEADIAFNAKDFTFSEQNEPSSSEVHFTSLVIHELGHALGLDHNDDGVMARFLSQGTVRTHLDQHVMSSLDCEYSS